MPYEWRTWTAPGRPGAVRASDGPHRPLPVQAAAEAPGAGGPVAALRLWPHRSLPPEGFVLFIGATAALLSLPLLALLGSAAVWVLLPFFAAALVAVWWALRATYRSGEVREELTLWPDRVELVRRDPSRPARRWEANPHWVRAALHTTGGPVPNYLTLAGSGRTVEIGAFLSEEERVALKPEIEVALASAR